jgi:ribonuclease R
MPSNQRELILKIMTSARGKPVSVNEVLKRGALDVGAKPLVRRQLRDLVQEGLLVADGNRYRMPPPKPVEEPPRERRKVSAGRPSEAGPILPRAPRNEGDRVVGSLTRKAEGYGFIAPLHGGEDLFVPPFAMRDALDGDLVQAEVGRGRDGRPVASRVTVVERRRQYAVGTYREPSSAHVRFAYVEPHDQSLGPAILVPASTVARDGDIVRVRLTDFKDGEVRGEIVSRLGLPGDPNVEVLSVAYGAGFSDLFPADTLHAAQETPDHVRSEDKQGRRDLTELPLVTIDGEDARDFDDAIFVERMPGGFRLVVAIADVTAYVTSGSALDREALRRATSVYFPYHVLPMLPERLSNGICSLNPHVERLCMVADMTFDMSANPLASEVYPAVMKSHARCTYTQVARLLDGEEVPELEHVKEMLYGASRLSAKMTKMRMKRGAIDFDVPESKIILNKEGDVERIERRPRNIAHRLIEEFMLAANEAVARFFESRDLPTVYRIHGQPKEEKLETFVQFAEQFGYEIKLDEAGRVTAAELNEFLHRIEGKPEQRALNHLLLRSMMQAVYSPENIGHFGLAAPSYLHFTSPIRRYPDLIVHRLLKELWLREGAGLSPGEKGAQLERLQTVAAHCSERERAATDAEREIDAFYTASFLRNFIGQRFPGTVASVAEFGLFVEVADPFCQGLIPSETLGDFVRFDPDRHSLSIGSKKSFGVGDQLEIEVFNANPLTRRIEFRLVTAEKTVDERPRQREPRRTRVLREAVKPEKWAKPKQERAPKRPHEKGRGGARAKQREESKKGGGKRPPRRR